MDKITNRRNPLDDIGDLKDCARMTIEFDSVKAMSAAKVFISRTKEVQRPETLPVCFEESLWIWFLSYLDSDRFNAKAQKSGYKDIKFFLKMQNGIIGEDFGSTSGMLVAKEKEHVIYDILRDVKRAPKHSPSLIKMCWTK
ncbi:hypothetical protein O9992_17130 [Vibrio lentus]|nr:hypothetical protein [Vibrio lentus]